MPIVADATTPAAGFETAVDREIAQATSRIRTHDLLFGGLVLVSLVAAYAAGMAVADRAFAFPDAVRQLALAGFAVVFAAVAAALFVKPLRRRVNPLYAATRVERTVADAKNSVVGYVELKERELNPVVRTALGARAAKAVGKADLNRAVDPRGLVRLGGVLAALLVTLVVLFFVFRPSPFASLMKRAFAPFAPTAIAKRTQIVVLQPEGGDVTLTASQPFTVACVVNGKLPDPNGPDRVRLLIRPSPAATTYEEVPLEQGNDRREWGGKVPDYLVVNGARYKLAAGDDETAEGTVTVRTVPLFTGFEATYEYPAYLRMKPETGTGPRLDGYRGTKVTLTATANREVRDGRMEVTTRGPDGADRPVVVTPGVRVPDRPNALRFDLTLTEKGSYKLFFTAAGGDRSPDHAPHAIEILADQPPQITIERPDTKADGVDLPANGQLAVDAKVGDDFGVNTVTLRLRLAGDKPTPLQPKPFRKGESFRRAADGTFPRGVDYKDSVDLAALKDEAGKPVPLKEGDAVEFWVEATDNQEPKANVGRSRVIRVTALPPTPPEDADRRKNERQEQEGKANAAQQKRLEGEKRGANAGPRQQPPAGAKDQPPAENPADPASDGPPDAKRQPAPNNDGAKPPDAKAPASDQENPAKPDPKAGDAGGPPKPTPADGANDVPPPGDNPTPEPGAKADPKNGGRPNDGEQPGGKPSDDEGVQRKAEQIEKAIKEKEQAGGDAKSDPTPADAGEGAKPGEAKPKGGNKPQSESKPDGGAKGDPADKPQPGAGEAKDGGKVEQPKPADAKDGPKAGESSPEKGDAVGGAAADGKEPPKPKPDADGKPQNGAKPDSGGDAKPDPSQPEKAGGDPSPEQKGDGAAPTGGSKPKPENKRADGKPSDPQAGGRPDDGNTGGDDAPAGTGKGETPPKAGEKKSAPKAGQPGESPTEEKPTGSDGDPSDPQSGDAPAKGDKPSGGARGGRSGADRASGKPSDPGELARESGRKKDQQNPDAKGVPNPKDGPEELRREREEFNKTARDLNSKDDATRRNAQERMDQSVGKNAREDAAKAAEGLDSPDPKTKEKAEEQLDELRKKKKPEKTADNTGGGKPQRKGGEKGNGSQSDGGSKPTPEQAEELKKKVNDLASGDKGKREAAEKEFDHKVGKGNREKVQDAMKNAKGSPADKAEAGRDAVDQLAKPEKSPGKPDDAAAKAKADELKTQAGDLASDDDAKRAAAEKAVDDAVGKEKRERLQKAMKDAKGGDPAKEAEAKRQLDEAAKAAGRGQKGNDDGPSKEDLEKLAEAAKDLNSPDAKAREAAEKAVDARAGKEAREEAQRAMKDLESPDVKTREAARKRVEDAMKKLQDAARGNADPDGNAVPTGPPGAGGPPVKDAMTDDPRNRLKSAELQLKTFKEHQFDKKLHDDFKMSQDDYDRFLKGHEEMVNRLREQAAEADKPATVPPNPTAERRNVSSGGRVEQRDAGASGLTTDGGGVAPPGYGDAQRRFADEAAKQRSRPQK